ncbi:MAG: DUF2934 domain-containing protein [Verrucomicrobia bacterium]|nr:MAG: DUF2934 domain-containing protein [Verrucomicrobiota bacterium]
MVPPNAGEKLLAKRPMLDKRIEIINTNKFVPKKNKIVQGKNQAPPEAGGAPAGMKIRKTPAARQTSTTRKTAGPAAKKTATPRTGKVSMLAEAGRMARPSDEEIRLRAYFISERRRRFALPGDADSDWLEAKRQLLSETGPR